MSSFEVWGVSQSERSRVEEFQITPRKLQPKLTDLPFSASPPRWRAPVPFRPSARGAPACPPPTQIHPLHPPCPTGWWGGCCVMVLVPGLPPPPSPLT